MKNGFLTIRTGLYSHEAFQILHRCEFSTSIDFFTMRDDDGEILICAFEEADVEFDAAQQIEFKNALIEDILDKLTCIIKSAPFFVAFPDLLKVAIFKILKIDLGVNFFSISYDMDEDVTWLINDPSICARKIILTSFTYNDKSVFHYHLISRKNVMWMIDYIKNGFKSTVENEEMMGAQLNCFEQMLLKEVREKMSRVHIILTSVLYSIRTGPMISSDDIKFFRLIVNDIKKDLLSETSDRFTEKIINHLDSFLKVMKKESLSRLRALRE